MHQIRHTFIWARFYGILEWNSFFKKERTSNSDRKYLQERKTGNCSANCFCFSIKVHNLDRIFVTKKFGNWNWKWKLKLKWKFSSKELDGTTRVITSYRNYLKNFLNRQLSTKWRFKGAIRSYHLVWYVFRVFSTFSEFQIELKSKIRQEGSQHLVWNLLWPVPLS